MRRRFQFILENSWRLANTEGKTAVDYITH